MERAQLRVLFVEDRPEDAELILRALQRGYQVEWQRVDTPEAFAAALRPDLDIILSDFAMPRFSGLQALQRLRASGLDIPFILISGTIGEDMAVEAMRAGAADYLLKDRLTRLPPAVEQAVEQRRLRQAAAQAEQVVVQTAARFKALIENSAEAIWLVDQTAVITYASPSTHHILGFTPEETVGRDVFSLLHPEDLPAAHVIFENLVVGHLPSALVQLRFLTQRGEWCWVEVGANNQLADPNVAAIVINFRDVTERVQRERELEAIARLSQALRLAATRADMLPIILEQVAALTNAAGATLDLHDPATNSMAIEAALGEWAFLLGHHLPVTTGLAANVMATGQTYVNPDARQDARYYQPALTPHTPAVAAVPLKAREAVIGVLWVGRDLPIGEDEVQLLAAVADIAASAIQRVTLHEQTQVQLQRLASLRTIDMAINASLDLSITLDVLISQALQQLGAHAAVIMLYDPNRQQLTFAAGRGLRTTLFDQLRVRLGEGLSGQVAAERRTQVVADLTALPPGRMRGDLVSGEGFVAFVGVPLVAKGQLKGVFEIFHRQRVHSDADWLEFVETLAEQAAIAIDNATVYADLQRSHTNLRLAYDSTLEGWSRALDLRDRETEGHTQRVTELSGRLGRAMGLAADGLVQMRRGALLHDIGKLGVPDAILHKPGPLTEDEMAVMRRHPIYARDVLAPIAYLRRALEVPHYHHEKWDGTGYPEGLSGEQIPLAARIFAVADVYDALRSDRPYRPGWTEAATRAYIYEQAGRHFDPAVVAAFRQWVETETPD